MTSLTSRPTDVVITPAVDSTLRAIESHRLAWDFHHAALRLWQGVPETDRRNVREHPLLATRRALAARDLMDRAGVLIRETREKANFYQARLTMAECRLLMLARGETLTAEEEENFAFWAEEDRNER